MADERRLRTPRKEIPHLFETGQRCSSEDLGKMLLAGQAEVRFEGLNTMPMFRRFAKKFTRTHEGYIGHNDNGLVETTFTGPGYFRISDSTDGEALFDYRDVPTAAPNHWPTIRSNRIPPYLFTYGNMVDAVRIISDDLVAGKAHRYRHSGPVDLAQAKVIDVFFLLVRASKP